MEDIAARRAAFSLLAEHKAKARFKPFSPPDGADTISVSYTHLTLPTKRIV